MQQTINQEQVKEWLSHPVTRLHQRRLALSAAQEVSQAKLASLVSGSETVEALGMRVIAVANRADGINEAYDHDPELFYTWLMEVPNE